MADKCSGFASSDARRPSRSIDAPPVSQVHSSHAGDFMLLPKGTIVAVADGEKFSLFSNTGDEAGPTLTPMAEPNIENETTGSGASNQNESQAAEDGFAGGIAGLLNKRVLDGEISGLIIAAAPRTL